jgi:hypothetical protein
MTVIEILPLLQKLDRQEKIRAMQFLLTELAQEEPSSPSKYRQTTPEHLGWPPGFFAKTYGSLRNINLVREPQGDYEVREELI